MATSGITESVLAAARKMGYKDVKEQQMQAVSEFVKGKDVFVALPTGYGKNFCYGCLPSIFAEVKGQANGIVIVVSPLIAIC